MGGCEEAVCWVGWVSISMTLSVDLCVCVCVCVHSLLWGFSQVCKYTCIIRTTRASRLLGRCDKPFAEKSRLAAMRCDANDEGKGKKNCQVGEKRHGIRKRSIVQTQKKESIIQ